MLRSFIAALILMMGALSAQAQPTQNDPSPAALWVGGYFGIHGGVGSADFDGVFDSSSIDRPHDNEDAVLGEFFELDGGLAGVHIGFNAKYGRLIYGVEADWSSFGQSARLFDPDSEGPNGSTTDNARVDLNWIASLRGRVGLMSARSLLFASAGVAWIDGEYTAHDADGALPGQSVIGSADIGTAGIVIGAGIEHALTSRFFIRLEGLYYTFNNRVATSTLTNDSDPDDFAKIEDIIVARIAASYRFGGSSSSQTSPPIMRNWTGLYAGAHIGYARVGFDSLFDADEISDPRDFEDSVLGRFFDLNGTVVVSRSAITGRMDDG